MLEVACGTGLFTRRLAPRVAHVTAVDAAPEVLAILPGYILHHDLVVMRKR
ncbi:MAG TPA: class I SAM-dependent methyltransferase [Casimicrobiaceae bacterium]